MKVQAERERIAAAEMMEKERRRAEEALASELLMTRAADQSASISNNKVVVSKDAGKPEWWNDNCQRARERYRRASEAFQLRPNKDTSDRYDEARKAVDATEQRAMREHIERRQSQGEEAEETEKGRDRWWNADCQEAKQKYLAAERQMRQDGDFSKERKIEVQRLRYAFRRVCRAAKIKMESLKILCLRLRNQPSGDYSRQTLTSNTHQLFGLVKL